VISEGISITSPHEIIWNAEELDGYLDCLNLKKEQLEKILWSDPALRYAGGTIGDVVKITRKKSICLRIVIE